MLAAALCPEGEFESRHHGVKCASFVLILLFHLCVKGAASWHSVVVLTLCVDTCPQMVVFRDGGKTQNGVCPSPASVPVLPESRCTRRTHLKERTLLDRSGLAMERWQIPYDALAMNRKGQSQFAVCVVHRTSRTLRWHEILSAYS